TTSGRASRNRSATSLKYLRIGNRSYSCRAMSGSLSQTPTISQPAIRRICDACASAIFPQPTIAILSMEAALPAALEVPMQPLGCRDLRHPSELGLELVVA